MDRSAAGCALALSLAAALPARAEITAEELEKPDNGPDWQLRFQVQFLFPK